MQRYRVLLDYIFTVITLGRLELDFLFLLTLEPTATNEAHLPLLKQALCEQVMYGTVRTFCTHSLNKGSTSFPSIYFPQSTSILTKMTDRTNGKHTKKPIPQALREQVWIRCCGEAFRNKCFVPWCKNEMTAFHFQAGHNVPESKGGTTDIYNLLPICSNCNQGMGNRYTIEEWNSRFGGAQTNSHGNKNTSNKTKKSKPKQQRRRFLSCFC